MNKTKYIPARFVLAAIFFISIFGMFSKTNAQTPIEMGTGSGSGGSGPTVAAQSARLLLNSSGTVYSTPSTTVMATATVSNQQYTGSGTGAGNPVLMFGATNTSSGTSATSRPNYAAMSDIGTPANTMYTNQLNGAVGGIDVGTNLAFNMYTSVHQWAGLTTPSTNNTRIYMADLTLTFSTPLTNPMLQFVGLGGTTAGLGITSELDLVTPGLTLTKLQGNTALSVTSTQINNGNSSGITASCAGNAACGTVRVNGNNISSIQFKVYMRGDGGAANWGSAANHAGDQWLIGLSIPETYSLSGNVFNDSNGLGDNTVNGTGINNVSGSQLYANLINTADGTVMGSVAVAGDGTYSFNGIPLGANVRVEISTNQGTPLAAAPSVSLPAGWSFTGENIGAGPGSDGTPNGVIGTTVNGNVTNVNIGLQIAPTAATVSIGGRVLTSSGAGIRNASVTIINDLGASQTVNTGTFGSYRFTNIQVGRIYVITVRAKRYEFVQSTQVLNVDEATGEINFYAYVD